MVVPQALVLTTIMHPENFLDVAPAMPSPSPLIPVLEVAMEVLSRLELLSVLSWMLHLTPLARMNETQQQLPVQPPLPLSPFYDQPVITLLTEEVAIVVTAPVAVLAFAITILGDGDVSERPGGGPEGCFGKFGNSTQEGGCSGSLGTLRSRASSSSVSSSSH